jgi:hypothetical protein
LPKKRKKICPKIKQRLGGGQKYTKFAIKKNAKLSPHGNNLQIREGFMEQAFSYTQPFTLAYSNSLASFQIALHF